MKGNMYWWFGVVEDVKDPLEADRLRVRPFGWYDPEVPVADLPWAQNMMSQCHEGTGQSPELQHLMGAWVFGFFMDGKDAQRPFVMGTFSGHEDLPMLSRGENTIKNTPVQTDLFTEPNSPYAAQYPNNNVRQTLSGHVKEYDDTPGAERIREYHKSGSFYEIHPDGTRVLKVVGKGYTLIADDENVHVAGTCNLVIDGDSKTRIKGNWDIEVGQDMNLTIGGNKTEKAKTVTETYESQTTNAGSSLTMIASRVDIN